MPDARGSRGRRRRSPALPAAACLLLAAGTPAPAHSDSSAAAGAPAPVQAGSAVSTGTPDPAQAAATPSGEDTLSAAASGSQAETVSDGGAEAPPLWLEVYGEGVYSRHEEGNVAGFTEAKAGKRLPGPLPADIYARFRVYRDRAGFYWNNRADGGFGARVSLSRKVSLLAFAEAAWGGYLGQGSAPASLSRAQARQAGLADTLAAVQERFYKGLYGTVFDANSTPGAATDRQALDRAEVQGDSTRKALAALADQAEAAARALDSARQTLDSLALIPQGAVSEYKAGFVFWHGWGRADGPSPSAWFAFPGRFWGEIYADGIYSVLSRRVQVRGSGGAYHDSTESFRNLVLYANPAVGFLVLDGRLGSAAVYAGGYAWFDTHRDWWNNLAMAGPGIDYTPFRDIDLSIKAEWMWGAYYGRERAQDPNPFPGAFSDARVTASFWHGLGM
jgi:hypothetical protein